MSMPRLLLSKKAWHILSAHRQGRHDSEAGGILIGEYYPATNLYFVCLVTRPCRADRRGPYFFHRDALSATKRAQRYWRASGGVLHYLGEWHSHSEPFPQPSITDLKTMNRLNRSATVVGPGLLLIIIGQKREWVGITRRIGMVALNMELQDDEVICSLSAKR